MKMYKEPEITIYEIKAEDVITTSGGLIVNGSGDGDGDNWDNWGV